MSWGWAILDGGCLLDQLLSVLSGQARLLGLVKSKPEPPRLSFSRQAAHLFLNCSGTIVYLILHFNTWFQLSEANCFTCKCTFATEFRKNTATKMSVIKFTDKTHSCMISLKVACSTSVLLIFSFAVSGIQCCRCTDRMGRTLCWYGS